MSRQHSPCLLASDAVAADFFFTSVLLCFPRSLLEICFSLFLSPILMRVLLCLLRENEGSCWCVGLSLLL